MNKTLKNITIAAAAALICISTARAVDEGKPVREKIGSGAVDWSSGTVSASAVAKYPKAIEDMDEDDAKLKAERVATVMARRNILEIVKGVRVESKTVVNDMMVSKDVIRTTVEGLVENSKVVNTEHLPDRSVRVTVEMSMRGRLSKELLDNLSPEKKGTFRRMIEETKKAALQFIDGILSAGSTAEAKVDEKSLPTGLIIDATELKVKPGLFPKIYDKDGNVIYGPGIYDNGTASEKGSVGIASSIEEAKKDTARLGKVALVSKALIPTGAGGIDLGIQGVDLSTLKGMMEDPATLKKCGVSVVYKLTF